MKKLFLVLCLMMIGCTDPTTTEQVCNNPTTPETPATPVPTTPEPTEEDDGFVCPEASTMTNFVLERDRDALFYAYDGMEIDPVYSGNKILWDRVKSTFKIYNSSDEIIACGLTSNWTQTMTAWANCQGIYSFTLDYRTPEETKTLTCTMYFYDYKKDCDDSKRPIGLNDNEVQYFITCPSSFEYEIDWYWRSYTE